ncbi:MAG: hypothetical protein HRT51_06645 [Colwellia sp.]|nr:hypothetical protein [Colwellia sp.]
MNQIDLERLNSLSEKALVETVSKDELDEFKNLLDAWSNSTELNLLQGFYLHRNLSQ